MYEFEENYCALDTVRHVTTKHPPLFLVSPHKCPLACSLFCFVHPPLLGLTILSFTIAFIHPFFPSPPPPPPPPVLLHHNHHHYHQGSHCYMKCVRTTIFVIP